MADQRAQLGDDLADGGVAGRADRRHAAETVQHPFEALQHDRHARLPQRVGIGFAFVAQRIEAGGDDQRRRSAGEVFGEQRILRRVRLCDGRPMY